MKREERSGIICKNYLENKNRRPSSEIFKLKITQRPVWFESKVQGLL
jgi:hypothetical protein